MVKFPEAEARLFHDKFVCKKCKTKLKATNLEILANKITCRKCGRKAFRPVRKK